MIDKNPTLFFILDKNLQVIEANPAWEAISRVHPATITLNETY
jgi:hypothetical protein